MGNKILVIIAEGFEEIEAVTVIDVLHRAGLDVETVGLNSLNMYGSHLIHMSVDKSLINVDLDEIGTVVLPGGMLVDSSTISGLRQPRPTPAPDGALGGLY